MRDIDSYLQYVAKSASDLSAAQQSFKIPKQYSSSLYQKYDVMKKFCERYPEAISRQDVISMFREQDIYLASVSAMIWGGINATRTRKAGDLGSTDLGRFLEEPAEKVVRCLHRIRELCRQSRFAEAFIACSEIGEFKLSGIGYAYYTKLFYFLGQADPEIKLKPLILDKWTTNAFLVLLKVEGELDVDDFGRLYLPVTPNKPGSSALRGGVKRKADTYSLFVKKMDLWASSVGITASQLEQFLFGHRLQRNNARDSSSNPRVHIWSLLGG